MIVIGRGAQGAVELDPDSAIARPGGLAMIWRQQGMRSGALPMYIIWSPASEVRA
ncbi:hypothetical protein BH23CHL1_BH23CHL1_25490 [soil metagenome]|jgi:hypothetical protein